MHASFTDEEVEAALAAVVDRVETTLATLDGAFPFVASQESGVWETTDDGNWCAGHWIGLLWIAHAMTNDERLAHAAREYTESMDAAEELLKSMFVGLNYNYAGFRAYDHTGEGEFHELGLTGADATLELYDERARQVPVGEYTIEGPQEQFEFGEAVGERAPGSQIGAVDMIYTSIPILWRAHTETGCEQYRETALAHADRHLEWYVRPNGSTIQEAEFDPETGELVRRYNDLAYSNETCWARGQGWNIAGLVYAYNATGAPRYRKGLELTVGYYRENAPDDLVPYWDFEDPAIPDAPRDTSAAALVAYGLIELDPDDKSVADLRMFGESVLTSLVANYLVTDPDDPLYGAVLHGCYDKPGEYATDNELIWTDYYLARALFSKLNSSLEL